MINEKTTEYNIHEIHIPEHKKAEAEAIIDHLCELHKDKLVKSTEFK